MPVKKSAKRALKKALRNKKINTERKKRLKLAIRKFLKLIKEKNKEEAKIALNEIYKQIDKASKRFIHKNKAARLKSKYAQILNKII